MVFAGDEPRLGLLQPDLGADGKPVFLDGVGCPRDNQRHRECNDGFRPTEPVITGAESFDQWYRTIDGTNVEFEREIELQETAIGSGRYRFSSNAFFPLSTSEGYGATPAGQAQNFLFTTEIHLTFTYVAGQVFTFRGDDDLWIFVNRKLALDLGGMHGEREASIDFDAQAAELGIVPGAAYAMDVFHAERHTSASNFTMETNIACFSPGILR
jgi:fibro-slime domain-containing protein